MITKSEERLNDVFGIEQPEADVFEGKSVDVNTGEIVPVNQPKQNLPMNQTPFSPLQKSELEKKEDDTIKKEATEDYEVARTNLRSLIDRGDELLDMAMRSVEMSEDPEAIEGAAKILHSLSTMNKSLMDLHRQRQDIYMKTRTNNIIKKALEDNPEARLELKQVNQNISFVGTSNDLAKLVQDMRNKEGK